MPEGCSVKAAMLSKDLGMLNPWLRNIGDVYRLHKDELNTTSNPDERYNRLVEINVQEQCVNVTKMAVVQKSFIKTVFSIIHGWVFDISTGRLTDFNIDFPRILASIHEIYDLTKEV